MSKSNEILLQNRLEDAIQELYEVDEFFDEVEAVTFYKAMVLTEDSGILRMTDDAGIVLIFPDGSEFQLTIKQSKEANT